MKAAELRTELATLRATPPKPPALAKILDDALVAAIRAAETKEAQEEALGGEWREITAQDVPADVGFSSIANISLGTNGRRTFKTVEYTAGGVQYFIKRT